MSEERTQRDHQPAGRHQLTAAALFAGLCVIAVAVFFGLRGQQAGAPAGPAVAQSPDLGLPDGEQPPWIDGAPTAEPAGDGGSGGSAPARGSAEPSTTEALPPAAVHTGGAFSTSWRRHWRSVAKTCKPTAVIEAKKDSRHLELPLELRISESGAVIAARRFGKIRDVGADGGYSVAEVDDEAVGELTRCYADAIMERIRFGRSTTAGSLRVWVLIFSYVD